jgi:predicted site-specific integrase-resolvase
VGNLGQRRFRKEDLASYVGLINKEENICDGASVFGYCRVSSAGQAKGLSKGEDNSLTRQIEAVKIYINNNYGIETPVIYSEVGSSLNFKRPKLTKMIRDILGGKYDNGVMVLHYKDRLARIGAELILLLCEIHNIKTVIIENNEAKSDAVELAEDVASFVQIMANRMMSARGAKVLEKHIDEKAVKRIHELRQSGMAINRISEVIQAEKLTTTKGGFITCGLVRKYLKERPQLEIGTNNSVQKYYEECIEVAPDVFRISKENIYINYVAWCRNKGINPVTMPMVGRHFSSMGLVSSVIHPTKNSTQLAWQSIKIKNAKLHIRVIPKGPYRVKQTAQKKENFYLFYKEILAGRWQGIRGELNQAYAEWCETNQVKPLNTRKIGLAIEELGHTPIACGKGHFYDFSQK